MGIIELRNDCSISFRVIKAQVMRYQWEMIVIFKSSCDMMKELKEIKEF